MELDQLYQDIILDHYRNPRNREKLGEDEVLVDEENPLCGDRIRLTATLEGGRIASVRFDGKGCAISQASASMMTEAIQGRTPEEAQQVIQQFIRVMTSQEEFDEAGWEEIASLGGVRRFPLRIKCATMSWHGMMKVLAKLAGE